MVALALVMALTMVIGSVSIVNAGKLEPTIDGYTLFGRHYYKVFGTYGTPINWSTANVNAALETLTVGRKTYVGCLVGITSAEENTFVADLIPSGNHAWIGAYQTSKDSEPLGNWAWVTGDRWTYTNWGSSEPNNSSGTEDWAHMYSDGFWNDNSATANIYFYVVEFAARW